MFRSVALMALAGCGRVGFEVATDGNGSAIGDVSDRCPHIVTTTQSDGDSDGVGDECEPNPAINREQITLFATMVPGAQPLTYEAPASDGVFTQLADAVRFDGDLATGGDNNLFGQLVMPLTVGDVRVAMGIDLIAVIPGSTNGQNQIALSVYGSVPNYSRCISTTFTSRSVTSS